MKETPPRGAIRSRTARRGGALTVPQRRFSDRAAAWRGRVSTHRFGARVGLAAVLVVVAISYLPALRAGFVWDDVAHIVDNPRVRRWSELPAAFEHLDGLYFRPLIFVSYAVEHAVWGLRPAGFHGTNLLLHLVNTFLLFLLVRRLGSSSIAGLTAAVLFGIHPLQTEAVAYISGRTDLLVVSSALATWLILLRPGNAVARAVLAGLFAAVAILSKESGYAVPVSAVWVAWRHGRTRRERLILAVPSVLVGAALLIARPGTLPTEGFLGPMRTVVDAGAAIRSYASLLFWPAALQVDRLTLVPTSPGAVLAASLCFALAVLLVVWAATRRGPTADFAFLAALFYLPVANLFVLYPVVSDWALFTPEHNLYAPLVGLAGLAGVGAGRLDTARFPRLGATVGVALLALLICGAALTWQRCLDWRDEETLFARAAAAGSLSPRVWYNLGNALLGRDELPAAEAAYERALELAPRDAEAWMNLGVARQRRRDYDGALDAYRRSADLAPRNAIVYENLGTLHWARRDADAARRAFERALALDPGRETARRALQHVERGPAERDG